MSFDYVNATYNVKAKRGKRAELRFSDGSVRVGTITRATHYVYVRFDGQKHSVPVHPTDLHYIEPTA